MIIMFYLNMDNTFMLNAAYIFNSLDSPQWHAAFSGFSQIPQY